MAELQQNQKDLREIAERLRESREKIRVDARKMEAALKLREIVGRHRGA